MSLIGLANDAPIILTNWQAAFTEVNAVDVFKVNVTLLNYIETQAKFATNFK